MSSPGGLSKDKKCRIAEIVQYSCDLEKLENGRSQVHCFPIPRIFRICPGRPAVEITKLVNIDEKTGEIEIPASASKTLPKAKPWRDVTRYKPNDTVFVH